MTDYRTYQKIKHDNEMRANGYTLFASKTLKNHTYWQLGHIHDEYCYDISSEWRLLGDKGNDLPTEDDHNAVSGDSKAQG